MFYKCYLSNHLHFLFNCPKQFETAGYLPFPPLTQFPPPVSVSDPGPRPSGHSLKPSLISTPTPLSQGQSTPSPSTPSSKRSPLGRTRSMPPPSPCAFGDTTFYSLGYVSEMVAFLLGFPENRTCLPVPFISQPSSAFPVFCRHVESRTQNFNTPRALVT